MKQVFRSKAAMALGWLWMAFAAFNAVDLGVRYSGSSSMIAAAVLAVLTALVFITCLRPAIVLGEDGVLVRNPLRNTFVPWRRVDEVAVSHSITITSGDRTVRCWTPQTSGRERAAAARRGRPSTSRGRYRTEPVRSKAEQAAAEALTGKTHADWVAEQITERAESARRRSSGATGAQPVSETPATDAQPTRETPAEGARPDPGALTTTWSPSALAALAAAAVVIVAAFIV
ncbi:hypothetical protein [Streptosporangium sp. NPDC051022]|uniref:hypothetical protein n=1 Tax=Streptosporangium sp. NPDC051022 TaxID=3155752 RepID=UPI00342F8A1C